MEKVLKLNNGDSISVINSNNMGVLIKNNNGILKVSEVKKNNFNMNVKTATISEITSYILITLLENNSIEIKKNKNNAKLIRKLLDNEFNKICGNNYSGSDIANIEFNIITYYEKE